MLFPRAQGQERSSYWGPVWCPLGHLRSTQPTKRGSVSLAGVFMLLSKLLFLVSHLLAVLGCDSA